MAPRASPLVETALSQPFRSETATKRYVPQKSIQQDSQKSFLVVKTSAQTELGHLFDTFRIEVNFFAKPTYKRGMSKGIHIHSYAPTEHLYGIRGSLDLSHAIIFHLK